MKNLLGKMMCCSHFIALACDLGMRRLGEAVGGTDSGQDHEEHAEDDRGEGTASEAPGVQLAAVGSFVKWCLLIGEAFVWQRSWSPY
eukprot:1147891-Pelagomonas_calceolata.AAC.3